MEKIVQFLDFEASSLIGGYPTQISICFFNTVTHEMDFYTRFIKPKQDWLDFMDWSPESEKIHGRSLEFLMENGADVEQVAKEVLEKFGGTVLYVDSPDFDSIWMSVLLDTDNYKNLPMDIHHINDLFIGEFTKDNLIAGKAYSEAHAKPAHDAENDVYNHANLLKGMLLDRTAQETVEPS